MHCVLMVIGHKALIMTHVRRRVPGSVSETMMLLQIVIAEDGHQAVPILQIPHVANP